MGKADEAMMFFAAWDQWQADCLTEWNTRHGEDRLLYGDIRVTDSSNTIEFAEDGDAYPHGIGGTGHVKHAVTPWSESAHYRK